MNKKSKLLLTSVGLAVLSGIAATGSTFAWFTATRTASLSYSNATVGTTTSNLSISYLGNAGTFDAPTGDLEEVDNITLTGGAAITDISGDGLNFVKPIWSATSNVASSITSVNTAVGNYLEISVSVLNEGSDTLHVYMGEGTSITATDTDASKAALKAARVAVITGTTVTGGVATGGDVKFLIAPEDTSHTYLKSSSTSATFPIDFADSAVMEALLDTHTNVKAPSAITTQQTITSADGVGAKLGVIDANSSLNVTYRLWIEGQDTDAVNAAIGGVLNFSAGIYALQA